MKSYFYVVSSISFVTAIGFGFSTVLPKISIIKEIKFAATNKQQSVNKIKAAIGTIKIPPTPITKLIIKKIFSVFKKCTVHNFNLKNLKLTQLPYLALF